MKNTIVFKKISDLLDIWRSSFNIAHGVQGFPNKNEESFGAGCVIVSLIIIIFIISVIYFAQRSF